MWVSNNILAFKIFLLSTLYNNVEGAEIWCYKSNINSHATYSLKNPEPLLNTSYYECDRKTIFITHGFGESANVPSVTAPAEAHLSKGDSNVCALDWSKEASSALGSEQYMLAVNNAMDVATKFRQSLIKLFKAGLKPNKTILIGHSLGAQLFGYAGRGLSELVNSVILLDPAGPLFEGIGSFRGADTTSAKKVMAIHTNPARLGSYENKATVDVYANCGNTTQPGCTGGFSYNITSDQNRCSHNRSYIYYAEAITNPDTFIARSASDCTTWKTKGGNKTISIEDELGSGAKGLYFFQTNSKPPYGRGNAGSYYEN